MTKSWENEGLIQTGGKIEADQIAVGHNARAIRYLSEATETLEQAGLLEIQTMLAHLIRVLEEHAGSLPNRDEIISSAEIVTKELSKEKPNKLTVTSVLEGIAGSAKSVTVIATAAQALRSAITTLL